MVHVTSFDDRRILAIAFVSICFIAFPQGSKFSRAEPIELITVSDGVGFPRDDEWMRVYYSHHLYSTEDVTNFLVRTPGYDWKPFYRDDNGFWVHKDFPFFELQPLNFLPLSDGSLAPLDIEFLPVYQPEDELLRYSLHDLSTEAEIDGPVWVDVDGWELRILEDGTVEQRFEIELLPRTIDDALQGPDREYWSPLSATPLPEPGSLMLCLLTLMALLGRSQSTCPKRIDCRL